MTGVTAFHKEGGLASGKLCVAELTRRVPYCWFCGAASVLGVGGTRRPWSSTLLETRTTHSKALSGQGHPELGKQRNRHKEASFSKHLVILTLASCGARRRTRRQRASGKPRLFQDSPETMKSKCEKEMCVSLVP